MCVSCAVALAPPNGRWFTTDSHLSLPLNLLCCSESGRPWLFVSRQFCWVRSLTEEVRKRENTLQLWALLTWVFSYPGYFHGEMLFLCGAIEQVKNRAMVFFVWLTKLWKPPFFGFRTRGAPLICSLDLFISWSHIMSTTMSTLHHTHISPSSSYP